MASAHPVCFCNAKYTIAPGHGNNPLRTNPGSNEWFYAAAAHQGAAFLTLYTHPPMYGVCRRVIFRL